MDLTTGAFLQANTDLALGQGEPKGLHLTRTYNSNLRGLDPTGLGPGWTHGYDIRLQSRSPNDIDLNEAGVAEVVPFMLATKTMLDAFSVTNADVQGWVICALAADWGGNQLLSTRTDIAMGGRTLEFVQLPDQSFVAPSCLTASLALDSNSIPVLTFRNSNSIHFGSYDQPLGTYYFTSIIDPYGNALTASYTSGPNNSFRIDYRQPARSADCAKPSES